MGVHGYALLTVRDDSGDIVRLGGSDHRRLSHRADACANHGILGHVHGPRLEGELNTSYAGRQLITAWNQDGGDWSEPVWAPPPADLETEGSSGSVRIQVVRAVIREPYWQDLNARGTVRETGNLTKFSNDLRQSVEHKADPTTLAPSARAGLVLLLDATCTPGHALDPVVSDYRIQHGDWTRSLGFDAVWIVGPSSNMARQLDQWISAPRVSAGAS